MKKEYGYECDWCGKTLCEDANDTAVDQLLRRGLKNTKLHFCTEECRNTCYEIAPEAFEEEQ